MAVALVASVALTGPTQAQPTRNPAAIAPARCGAGSHPETGLQGEVPIADRNSGRSARGFNCNLFLVGQYQGDGATWYDPSYGHCSYLGSFFPGDLQQSHPGVQVVDASNPRHPVFSAALSSTAMLAGTWESLKVDPVHGYLAATGVPLAPGEGALSFDIYDIKTDCAHPRLLNPLSAPLTVPQFLFGHEGVFSPDGNTYYAMSASGAVTAIDVSNPHQPKVVYEGITSLNNHGASLSPDGRTLYGVTAIPAGVQILDVSDIQRRKASPQVREISHLTWSDGLLTQHTINFTSHGHRFLYAIDEGNTGAVRLIDIANPAKPVVVREYRLAIEEPSAQPLRVADTGGDGVFGYDAHYCSIDRGVDPTMLACGYFQSGVRLYDIRQLMRPVELGYYNPPAQLGHEATPTSAHPLWNSPHALAIPVPNVLDPDSFGQATLIGNLHPSMNTDWCSSPPFFRPNNTLWVTCQDNGFMVLHYVAPRASGGGRTGTTGTTTESHGSRPPAGSTAHAPRSGGVTAQRPTHAVPDLPTAVNGGESGVASTAGSLALPVGLALLALSGLGVLVWMRRRATR